MAEKKELNFQELSEKAKALDNQRSLLQAKEETLSKQIEELQSSLVQEYGENYMSLFDDAVERIKQWDMAHA